MASYHCLTFLTDYGLEDGFVAACHGVALRIAPDVRIIDITHLVPPGDIRRGAAVLAQTVPYLPRAVHVAVVDPGVGTARLGVAVASADGSVFVGPDNGLLSWAVEAAGGAVAAVSLTSRDMWLDSVTATFHGRDIFMPVAARLATGAPFDSAGTPLDTAALATLPRPASRVTRLSSPWPTGADPAVADPADAILAASGEVLTVDRFGNVQLSITASDATAVGLAPGTLARLRSPAPSSPPDRADSLSDRADPAVPAAPAVPVTDVDVTVPFGRTFGDVPPGELVIYPDSSGLIAIAANGASAAERFPLRPGAPVALSRSDAAPA